MKKFIFIFSIIIAIVIYKSYQTKESNLHVRAKKVEKDDLVKRNIAFKKAEKKKKPKVMPLIYKKREVASSRKISNPADLVITNKFNSNWKEVTKSHILRNFKVQEVKVELSHVKSIIYVKYNSGVLAEKVKVELTLPSGKKSRYMALIDSETGSIINTWNRTRYEFKERLLLSGKGAEYQ